MLTTKQMDDLACGRDVPGFTCQDDPDEGAIEVGKHKDCDVMLTTFRKEGDPKLYGFLWDRNYLAGSFFERPEVFEVEAYQHTETRYRRADGRPFDL